MKSALNSIIVFALIGTACGSKPKDESPVQRNPAGVVDAGLSNRTPKEINSTRFVIDAGIYRENEEYTDIVNRGGRGGKMIPTENFFISDREEHAPLNRLWYVLTEDSPARCIRGKFTFVEGRKKLIVYSASAVPTSFCIYQKKSNPEAEGFSLHLANGGICKPTFQTVGADSQNRKIASVESVDNIVPVKFCTEGTLSWGENVEGPALKKTMSATAESK